MRVVKSSGFIKSKKVLFRNRGRIRKAMFDFCIVFPFKLSGSVGCKIVDDGLFQNYLHTFICLAKMHELRNHICREPIYRPDPNWTDIQFIIWADIPRAFRQRFYTANIISAIMPVTP